MTWVAGAGSFKQGMLGKEERMANYAKQLPYNFSWIKQGQLAGTSIPSTVAQLEGLVREGVRPVNKKSLMRYGKNMKHMNTFKLCKTVNLLSGNLKSCWVFRPEVGHHSV